MTYALVGIVIGRVVSAGDGKLTCQAAGLFRTTSVCASALAQRQVPLRGLEQHD